MAGGDYGNVCGNKAKTKRGQKPRHQGLTVVLFVPFVGDEDGRKGVVSSPRWILGAHGKGGQKNPRSEHRKARVILGVALKQVWGGLARVGVRNRRLKVYGRRILRLKERSWFGRCGL
jgi:hypothetical protein